MEDALLELHPYETPEIIALPVAAGADAYLSWIEEETKEAGRRNEDPPAGAPS